MNEESIDDESAPGVVECADDSPDEGFRDVHDVS